MRAQIPAPQSTFIVRFWWEVPNEHTAEADEPGTEGIRRWHARIEHIQSGEGVSVRDTQQLLAFFEDIVGLRG